MRDEDDEDFEDPDMSFDDWSGMSIIKGATGRPRGRPRKPDDQVSYQGLWLRDKRDSEREQGLHVAKPIDPREEREKLAKPALQFALGTDRELINAWVEGGSDIDKMPAQGDP